MTSKDIAKCYWFQKSWNLSFNLNIINYGVSASSEESLMSTDVTKSQHPTEFSLEQKQLFKRFEEKHDLPYPAYQQWQSINHPTMVQMLENQPNEVARSTKEKSNLLVKQLETKMMHFKNSLISLIH